MKDEVCMKTKSLIKDIEDTKRICDNITNFYVKEEALQFYNALVLIEEFRSSLPVDHYIKQEGREGFFNISIFLVIEDFDFYISHEFLSRAGEFTRKINDQYGVDFSVIYERINLNEKLDR